MSDMAMFHQLPEFLCKIDQFFFWRLAYRRDHEGQEADSQRGTGCPLSDLWRGAGREVRTRHRTAPDRAAS
jgi:hypothetical protein